MSKFFLNKKAFTLIELLLYLGIVSVIFIALVSFAWNIIEGGMKSSVGQEVSSNGYLVMEKIKSKVRNAKDVVSVNTTSLTLQNISGPNSIIDLSAGNIRINEGAAINLNSADVIVSDLIFTDLRSLDNKTKQIGIRFTISYGNNQVRAENRKSLTLESSAELRGI